MTLIARGVAVALLGTWLGCSSLVRAESSPDVDGFEIFPAPERSSSELSAAERTLLDRPDRRRPEEQLTTEVFGRPLTTGFNYDGRSRFRSTPFKDSRDDELLVVAQNVSIDLFYRISERASVYLKGNAIYASRWVQFDDHPLELGSDSSRERGFVRGESWLYLRRLFDTPMSLQAGRQRIFDEREWWWDQNLDSVRAHYDRDDLHAELSIAQELAKVATFEDRIDPEEEDVLRVLGRVTWAWRKRNELSLFFLHSADGSDTETVGDLVDSSRKDESDADLTWLGISARGTLSRPGGRLDYWVDSAVVNGRETGIDYQGRTDNRRVDSIDRHSVRGWGLDVGTTWQPSWEIPFGSPTLTLGYAVGSGDSDGKDLGKSDLQRASDRSFRQTGLQDNNARFRGVNRFRYYGELLDPELSNLRIGTAAIGFRVLENSSVELLYHWYEQVHAAKFVRGATVRRQPAGRKRDIGQEIDLVIGIEEWKHLEIEATVSAFRAGSAYGDHFDTTDPTPGPDDFVPGVKGDWSYLLGFRVTLNF